MAVTRREILAKIVPGGKLLGLDADPLELPKTEARLRALGYDETIFTAHRSNFAGLLQMLAAHQPAGADLILADLGVSSMQIDDPDARLFREIRRPARHAHESPPRPAGLGGNAKNRPRRAGGNAGGFCR